MDRERIIDTALALFNERGLESVGMRDLARSLGIAPGNLTYHFPRKQDVVEAVMERLSERNSRTLGDPPVEDDLAAFLEAYRGVFRNQAEFRCLLLALVHVMRTYPDLHRRYAHTTTLRRTALAQRFAGLRDRGALARDTSDADLARLVSTCSLISRFWLSEWTVDAPRDALEDRIAHALSLLAGALATHAAPTAAASLRPYLAGVRTATATAPSRTG